VSVRFECHQEGQRARGISRAAQLLTDGDVIVMPTDTVYGIACDAFSPAAVSGLLATKGRGRAMPPPVLIPHVRTLDGIATRVSPQVRALAEAFWPGGLTIVCHAQPTLDWDLGDIHGTVAVRMPLHPVALELLERTGPLAVSSANLTGQPPAVTCDQASEQFGDTVALYLNAGPSGTGVPSTIIDGTQEVPVVLRDGGITREQLAQVLPALRRAEGEPAR
jgi:L-threonylcarbamoyladenylate synthase